MLANMINLSAIQLFHIVYLLVCETVKPCAVFVVQKKEIARVQRF